jgi:predicted MarR family transcription regulator
MDEKQPGFTWHLAPTEEELVLINFEFLFWRTYYSWIRWQEDCQKCIANDGLTSHEIALLHVIGMNNSAKTVYELGRLLNRDDLPNIQYGIKKLIDLKYAEKVSIKSEHKKAIAYQLTPQGKKNTEAFTVARQHTVSKLMKTHESIRYQLEEATKTMSLLKGLYEEASRLTAAYKSPYNLSRDEENQ